MAPRNRPSGFTATEQTKLAKRRRITEKTDRNAKGRENERYPLADYSGIIDLCFFFFFRNVNRVSDGFMISIFDTYSTMLCGI